MELLDTVYLGNSVRAWATAIGLLLIITFSLRFGVALFNRRLAKISERTENQIDDIVAAVFADTKSWALLYAGFWFGVKSLVVPDPVHTVLRYLTVIIVVLQVGVWGNVAIAQSIKYRVRESIETDPAAATTMTALGFLGRILLWSVLLLMALDNVGVEIGPVIAGLGVGGIAVALAVQNVLGDLFASLSIVLDKPFVIGDFIVIGDFLGSVEHIGLKTTRLRSLSGEQLVFSNSDLLQSRIRNYKRMQERRILFSLGVIYQTPREMVSRIAGILREVIESNEQTRFDRAHFKSFGPSSLDFEAVYYVLSAEYAVYMDIQQKINLAIMERFEAEGIEFAYPTQTLYVPDLARLEPESGRASRS
ncbi:MAG: mechanosensitive ion channel family protein [Gemmatimonadota bacterium]|jgi:small-conductance mechanosensitive channel